LGVDCSGTNCTGIIIFVVDKPSSTLPPPRSSLKLVPIYYITAARDAKNLLLHVVAPIVLPADTRDRGAKYRLFVRQAAHGRWHCGRRRHARRLSFGRLCVQTTAFRKMCVYGSRFASFACSRSHIVTSYHQYRICVFAALIGYRRSELDSICVCVSIQYKSNII